MLHPNEPPSSLKYFPIFSFSNNNLIGTVSLPYACNPLLVLYHLNHVIMEVFVCYFLYFLSYPLFCIYKFRDMVLGLLYQSYTLV